MVSGEDCPIILEKEVLTFDIPSFPMEELNKLNYDYSASVTGEYTFYNPTDEEITLELFLSKVERRADYLIGRTVNYREPPYS